MDMRILALSGLVALGATATAPMARAMPELILGRALKGKDDAVIVTKVGYFGDPQTRQIAPTDASPAAVRASIDNSRKRLQRDRIDIALLHINEHPVGEAAPVFDTLARLRSDNKIGGFGWSTDHPERLSAYASREGFVAVENDFNVFTPASELMGIAERERLVSLSRLPLAMGLLTGKYTAGTKLPGDDVRGGNAEWMVFFQGGAANPHYLARLAAIRELLTSGGRTLAQGALGWILARSPIALPVPGFTRPEQIEDNLGALDKGPLPAAGRSSCEPTLRRQGLGAAVDPRSPATSASRAARCRRTGCSARRPSGHGDWCW